jgi:hypothetical protein
MNCRQLNGRSDFGAHLHNPMPAITRVIVGMLASNVPRNFDPDAAILTNESWLHLVRHKVQLGGGVVSQGVMRRILNLLKGCWMPRLAVPTQERIGYRMGATAVANGEYDDTCRSLELRAI